jgi:beta-galactosidase
MHAVLIELAEYSLPIVVTGNGVATTDDGIRCRYLLDHLAEVRRAMEDGVDIRGYFHRSLLDSFEWTRGYSVRYGLFHVDKTTKTRTPNQSAFLYKEFCESGAVRRGTVAQFCPGWQGEKRTGEL